ncbi:MAG: Mur ligase family protein [Spirochaetia bacterium]|nr:Mur ligase family protein [Spirochaetia bacterium]
MFIKKSDKIHIHFAGICGTAMASAAVMLKKAGHTVTGSDVNFYPPMGDYLKENNIKTFKGYSAENLKRKPDLAVIGNALSRDNVEAEVILKENIFFLSLAELIRFFFLKDARTLVVSGTHGKSTTTALASWVFNYCGQKPGYLFAAISNNFKDSGRMAHKDGIFIIEGDEYDNAFFDKRSKFLQYMPHYLIINNIEYDHSDIFNSIDEILLSFRRLAALVPENGFILANADDKNVRNVVKNARCRLLTFGKSKKSDFRLSKYFEKSDGTVFNIEHAGKTYTDIFLPLAGEKNALNALATFAAGQTLGLKPSAIFEAFQSFKGLKRRLEKFAQKNEIIFYDDFAHHPTSIKAVIESLKNRHKNSRVVAVLEPRSNTMVKKIMQNDLYAALQKADVIIIGEIYRKEKIHPKERIDVRSLIKKLSLNGKEAYHIENINNIASKIMTLTKPKDIVLLMSNGSFGGLRNIMQEKSREGK